MTMSDHEVSVRQEAADTKTGRPHIVVLGVGASRASSRDEYADGGFRSTTTQRVANFSYFICTL